MPSHSERFSKVIERTGASYSVNDIAALARHASMSSSYKPALLKALVRIVRRGAAREIELSHIGAEFVEMYWVQTVVFRLRQAATLTAEPEVVRRIRSASDLNGVRRLAELSPEARTRLDREMAKVLAINVLDRFHRSKPLSMPNLYEWSPGESSVRLSDAAVAFLKADAHALETIANHWWAKYLERVNMLAPLIIDKVERNGVERSSLARYLRILIQTDEPRCFYCDRPLADSGVPHVDHVIPWSFLLADPLWDLVLACASCNLRKSDTLPDRSFLTKLSERGARRAKLTLPSGFASPYLRPDEIDRFFDAALSVEWPSGWTP